MNYFFCISIKKIPHIIIFILFIFVLQMLQISSQKSLQGEYQSFASQANLVAQRVDTIVKNGDTVFLSTNSTLLKSIPIKKNANTNFIQENNENKFDSALLSVLDDYCANGNLQDEKSYYFVWTQENRDTILDLSTVSRKLKFYFNFEAVLPYSGIDTFAIDKVIKLIPKEKLVNHYCEVRRIADKRSIMVIINGQDFSPWIGSVKTGNITWLASTQIRAMQKSDYTIGNIPPNITYDVYWMGGLNSPKSWSFKNQDTEAYKITISEIRKEKGIVLMDRNAELGIVAEKFIKECDPSYNPIDSLLFRQMCIK